MSSNRRDSNDTREPDSKEPAQLRQCAQWENGADPVAGLNLEKMQAELEGKLAQEKGFAAWLRSRPTPLRASLAGLVIGLLAFLTMALWIRPDFDVYPLARMHATLATIAGLIVLNLILLLWPLQLPAAPRWLLGFAVACAPIGLFFWYSAPAAHVAHPKSLPDQNIGSMLVHALKCLTFGSVAAAAFYSVFRALDRGGSNRLLLMAACAGLGANLLLQLHCPSTSPMHLVIGHLGVVVLCFGFAAWREQVTGQA
jgi:hypothetical protein